MSGKDYLNNTNFFKRNMHEAIKYIVPDFYLDDDNDTFGKGVDLADQIVNANIDLANNISTVLNVSALSNSTVFSSLGTINGIAPYFIKQNDLVEITPEQFELKILNRLGRSFYDFSTSAEFSTYLTGGGLADFTLNQPTSSMTQTWTGSATHQYLIENLSWLYFLNTSGTTYSPSSAVHDLLVNKTYRGSTITIDDCIKGLMEYVWKDGQTQYYPSVFVSGVSSTTSGTQQLDKLKTWIEVIYSPLYANNQDFFVRDRFQNFIASSTKTTNKLIDGPFSKLLRALSFSYSDIDNDTEQLNALYDIEDCPKEYLPLLAELIGWNLFGDNESRWRLQLKNAVEVYKRVGTAAGLQFALNSVFPKDIFAIQSRVTELWESYIPYLIFYSLATESDLFKSNDTWTKTIANSLNVSSYSISSIEDNMKLAVDRIIYDTYLEFTSKFNIPNVENGFNYRGRTYPIPPFEEYPYYVNVEVDQEMVDFITDRLACFGVRKAFALQVRDYLNTNLINSDDEIRSSSWLFFTSGYNEPPNLANIIPRLYDKSFEYVSLWSGKSSHFKMMFEASEFDFTVQDDYNPATGDAIIIASKVINEFSPAHSIPLINLQLSATDSTNFDSSNVPIIQIGQNDFDQLGNLGNYETSSLYFNSYRRDRTGGTVMSRGSTNSLQDSIILNASGIATTPRSSLRRRSYVNLMPKEGYYDRTGFNAPIHWSMASGLSGAPLGFIPSSMSFASISDHVNLPDVYTRCYNLSSNESIYGYDVSNTMASRGLSALGMVDSYVDRCQTPPIYALMHKIKEKAKPLEASSLVLSATDSSSLQLYDWKNVVQSYANSKTASAGWFPNQVEDYYNFKFGTGLHTYFNYYTKEFHRHYLAGNLHRLDGPNIFAHTFGSIFQNSDFNNLGVNGSTYVTSSLSAIQTLGNGGALFSYSSVTSTGYVASSSYIDTFEYGVSSVIQGVDLIQTSGTSNGNNFKLIKLPRAAGNNSTDKFLFDKMFIQQKSINGLGRFKVDTKSHTNSSLSGHPISENFLLPEHDYSFTVKALASNGNGTLLGGSQVGVWIHTAPENGEVWSYNKNGVWTLHDDVLTKTELFDDYVHRFGFKDRNRLDEAKESETLYKRLSCIDIVSGISDAINPLLTFEEGDFEELTVTFNTHNRKIRLPERYLKNVGVAHRKTQNYIIEVFKFPDSNNTDHFVLFESINLVDSTLNRLSKYLANGVTLYDPLRPRFCPEYLVDLSKEDINTLLKFWNTISGKNSKLGYASRNTAQTASLLYTSGGSRADYRIKSEFGADSIYGLDPTAYEHLVIQTLTVDI